LGNRKAARTGLKRRRKSMKGKKKKEEFYRLMLKGAQVEKRGKKVTSKQRGMAEKRKKSYLCTKKRMEGWWTHLKKKKGKNKHIPAGTKGLKK